MFSGQLLIRLALNHLENSKDEKSEDQPHREGLDLELVSLTPCFLSIKLSVFGWSLKVQKLIFKHKEGDLVLLFYYMQQ